MIGLRSEEDTNFQNSAICLVARNFILLFKVILINLTFWTYGESYESP